MNVKFRGQNVFFAKDLASLWVLETGRLLLPYGYLLRDNEDLPQRRHHPGPRGDGLVVLGRGREVQLFLQGQDGVRLLPPQAQVDPLVEALHEEGREARQHGRALGVVVSRAGDARHRPPPPPEQLQLVAHVDRVAHHDPLVEPVQREQGLVLEDAFWPDVFPPDETLRVAASVTEDFPGIGGWLGWEWGLGERFVGLVGTGPMRSWCVNVLGSKTKTSAVFTNYVHFDGAVVASR